MTQKSRWTVLALWFFFSFLGVHRLYVRKYFTGFLWMFSLGLFGIGSVIDFFLIVTGAFRTKEGYEIPWSIKPPYQHPTCPYPSYPPYSYPQPPVIHTKEEVK